MDITFCRHFNLIAYADRNSHAATEGSAAPSLGRELMGESLGAESLAKMG
jgi:hypothetical protein